MDEQPDLTIIIVNWNSASYLQKCLASVYGNTKDLDFEVIVIDNASFDGCDEMIRREFPQVKFIQSKENLGFAKANNLGFDHIKGRNTLFLNPDTEVVGSAIKEMVSVLDTAPDAAIVGAKLLNSDLSVQTSCIKAYPTILNQIADAEQLRRLTPRLNLWGMRPLFEPDHGRPVEVEVVSGACLMIKREVFEQVGLFSTDYFMYSEDLDLCYKAKKAGKKVYYLGSATIVHHGGQSSKKRGGEAFVSPLMKEALLRFLEKTHGPFYAALYRLTMLLISILRIAVLGVLLSIPSARLDKDSLRHSLAKWHKILRWSIGLEAWTRQVEKAARATRQDRESEGDREGTDTRPRHPAC